MEVLGLGIILIPVIFVVCVAIAALPLHLTVKMFGVRDSGFGKAVQVTVLAWVASLVIGIVLGVIGMIIPILPHALAVLAPFVVYVVLIQKMYELNTIESVIVAVIQTIICYLLVAAAVIAVLVPLGIGAALIGAAAGG